MTSMDMEFVPDLIGKSELLTDDIRKKLCKKIPPRVEGETLCVHRACSCGELGQTRGSLRLRLANAFHVLDAAGSRLL